MNRFLTFVAFLFTTVNAFGQVGNNLVDISGGYALTRSEGVTANGWYGDIGIRAYKSLYAVGGLSAVYHSDTAVIDGNSFKLSSKGYSVGGGPRVFITRRHSVISPFVDGLLSFQRSTVDVTNSEGSLGAASINLFGLEAGAGLDFRIKTLFSIRIRPAYGMATAQGETGHGFGLSTGIVFHFGETESNPRPGLLPPPPVTPAK